MHSGGAHSFTVCCRSPRPGYTHNWREAMAPYGLVVACGVSAAPNSPPGTTTELPCCHNRQNFLKFFFSRSSARFRFSVVEGRYLTASRAVLFQDRFECTPVLCTHETPVSISDIHRDTVLCGQESHRNLPLSHIELPSTLFFCESVALPHTVVRSAAT